MTDNPILDFAIVGGGVSGVYSAWRLKQDDPSRKIVVFEGSGHIGGRLLSVRPPGIKDMVAELGGMRILPAVQPRISRLLDALNDALPPGELIETYDFPVDQPQNIAYLRGIHLRLSDFTQNPDKVPYHVAFLERGGTPGTIILNAIEQICPGITHPGLNEYERRQITHGAEFAGLPLYQQGFWNVLLRVISGEAFQLGVDAGGYNTTLTNWNAADAIPWYLSDFGVDPDYKGFKKGFQQVPLALARLFRDLHDAGAPEPIRLNSRVDSFEWENGLFTLAIGEERFQARTLILAMPRRSLELLLPACPPLHDCYELIASVTPRPLFKLFTTYNSPWWRAAGYSGHNGQFIPVEAGRTVTDLPVRQTYYWPQDDGSPAVEGSAMLMASYDDGSDIGFWDGLRPRRRQAWQAGLEIALPDEPFIADRDGDGEPDAPWFHYQAPQRMVAEVARQLATIHGLDYTPKVRHAAFRDWGDDPFGGGWNSWNVGVKSWEVKERMVQPNDDISLHICGEAYSDAQGWVEGALQTADMVLARLGLASL